LLSVYEDDGTDDPGERWRRYGNRILTNYDTVNITYVKSVTDPDDFDDLFAEVLRLELQLKLIPAIPGTKSKQLSDDIKEQLRDARSRAKTVCSQENNTSGRSDWNLARYR
jgi:hypothetical protein